ncbi:hypothetical protein WN51_06350 [Melipona quadrifasciata]|uniref:Uncharacterized protein n=1 Tax=Melipona quadrifasciata TaxID=166423 RepID=A0A0M8ZR00_9HYME|nr:hypothetical protein WN51_06350 [Melipona quadrifasciata]
MKLNCNSSTLTECSIFNNSRARCGLRGARAGEHRRQYGYSSANIALPAQSDNQQRSHNGCATEVKQFGRKRMSPEPLEFSFTSTMLQKIEFNCELTLTKVEIFAKCCKMLRLDAQMNRLVDINRREIKIQMPWIVNDNLFKQLEIPINAPKFVEHSQLDRGRSDMCPRRDVAYTSIYTETGDQRNGDKFIHSLNESDTDRGWTPRVKAITTKEFLKTVPSQLTLIGIIHINSSLLLTKLMHSGIVFNPPKVNYKEFSDPLGSAKSLEGMWMDKSTEVDWTLRELPDKPQPSRIVQIGTFSRTTEGQLENTVGSIEEAYRRPTVTVIEEESANHVDFGYVQLFLTEKPKLPKEHRDEPLSSWRIAARHWPVTTENHPQLIVIGAVYSTFNREITKVATKLLPEFEEISQKCGTKFEALFLKGNARLNSTIEQDFVKFNDLYRSCKIRFYTSKRNSTKSALPVNKSGKLSLAFSIASFASTFLYSSRV